MLLKAIVGFELTIAGMEGKVKLSQNAACADRVWGASKTSLIAEGRSDLAGLMGS